MAIRFLGVDDSKTDLTEKRATSINDKSEWYYGSDYQYKEVTLSSAEILDLGNTPIDVLDAPGASNYYEWKVVLEYTYDGANPYTLASDAILVGELNEYNGGIIKSTLITKAVNTVGMTSSFSSDEQATIAATELPVTNVEALNEPLSVTTWDGNNPAGSGTGTILAKVWYKVKTFGTEL